KDERCSHSGLLDRLQSMRQVNGRKEWPCARLLIAVPSERFSGVPQRHCCLLPLLFNQRPPVPLMAAGDFTVVVGLAPARFPGSMEGGFTAPGALFMVTCFTMAFSVSAAGSGSEGFMRRIGGARAIPTSTSGMMGTIPITSITVTIL